MTEAKSSARRAQISCARVVPLHIETAKQLGGGARGRTLAIIYRHLCYWSKYAKWKGKNGKKMFFKSQRELAGELGYSEKTINRAIKALRELGLVVVEKLHSRYWKQVFFYYLPHSAFAAAEPEVPEATTMPPAPPAPAPDAPVSGCSTTTKPSSRSAPVGAGAAVHPAAQTTAASMRARGGGGFGKNVRIQQREYKPLLQQSLGQVVERCNAIAERMRIENQQGMNTLIA